MENQGKTERQVRDAEVFAFWGLMGLFISIAVIAISPSNSSEPELKEAKLTIERLKKSHDSLQWKYDSVWGQEIHNTRMLNRYQTG